MVRSDWTFDRRISLSTCSCFPFVAWVSVSVMLVFTMSSFVSVFPFAFAFAFAFAFTFTPFVSPLIPGSSCCCDSGCDCGGWDVAFGVQ